MLVEEKKLSNSNYNNTMNEKLDELIKMLKCLQYNLKKGIAGDDYMLNFAVNCHVNLILDKAREIKAELED